MEALAPDVIVPLDDAAAEQVPGWCGANRSVVVVEFSPNLAVSDEVVPWRVGRASGRVRARIGRRVDVPRLVDMLHRLCAGPHPSPPSDLATPESMLHETAGEQRWSRAGRRTSVIAIGMLDAAASRRVEGLADHLSAAGVTVAVSPIDPGIEHAARTADVLLLVGVGGGAVLENIIEERRHAGKATVVDLAPNDLVTERGSDLAPSVTPEAARLAERCGRVTSAGGATHAAVRGLGVRTHVLPSVLTRARSTALRDARQQFDGSTRTVGWYIGSARTPTPPSLDAVADALLTVLADWPDLRVEAVGDAVNLPTTMRRHDRLRIASEQPGLHAIAAWTVYVWTPPLLGGEVADDALPFVEVSYAGVPSVLSAASRGAIEGHLPAELVVLRMDQSEEWAEPVRMLVDDQQKRAQRSSEAVRRSHALYGPSASKAVVNRFLGWALGEPTSW
jgi:hypothetical protein